MNFIFIRNTFLKSNPFPKNNWNYFLITFAADLYCNNINFELNHKKPGMNTIKKTSAIVALCILFSATTFAQLSCSPPFTTDTFNYTGTQQMFVVPSNVTQLYIEAYGAKGADGSGTAPGQGGLGAKVTGTINVIGGSTYYIYVGQMGIGMTGGYNGGGSGAISNGGGGGGASDIRFNGTTPADRILIAGGGGGGGGTGCESIVLPGGNGGAGGGGSGTDGASSPDGAGGFGAIDSAGGAEGAGCSGYLGMPGTSTVNEIGGTGGAGQACCCFNTTGPSEPGGGGGGGGMIGGGGGGGGSAGNPGCSGNDKGGGGGGAGGTSFASSAFITPVMTGGANPGNGFVNICYDITTATKDFSSGKTTVRIFPNPAVNTIYITFKTLLHEAELEIYSSIGEKVYAATIASPSKTIDVSSLSNGIYIVKVSANGTIEYARVTVSK